MLSSRFGLCSGSYVAAEGETKAESTRNLDSDTSIKQSTIPRAVPSSTASTPFHFQCSCTYFMRDLHALSEPEEESPWNI